LAPANDPDHWDVIEGQGSLFHASFAGVSLGLLHGAQPDALVLCHEPTRAHMRGLPDYPLPGLKDCIALNLEAARLTNPDVSAVGVAINTSAMPADEARALLEDIESDLDLPTVDSFKDGVAPIVDRLR
ncbi:MAG: NAD-dependent epimerase/dehydratase family protein, partial [Kiloniellales bacterium]